MPRTRVGDITLAYEIWGKGIPVVLTPQAWYPRNVFFYLIAGRLSAHHQVVLWDRRNSGASDVAIEDAPSDYHLWADDLHQLLSVLDMSPAYLAGASGGCVLSLLMAHLYPEDVKGLILLDPPAQAKPLIDAHYFELAEVAESQGMEGVIAHSTEAWVRMISGTSKQWFLDGILNWVAETIQMNPSNRARFLSMDPTIFSATLRKWGQWTNSERLHLASLSDEALSRIAVPSLVSHGFNANHPEYTAKELANLLPNAELANYSNLYTPDEIKQVQESDNYVSQNAFLKLPFIEAYLARLESA